MSAEWRGISTSLDLMATLLFIQPGHTQGLCPACRPPGPQDISSRASHSPARVAAGVSSFLGQGFAFVLTPRTFIPTLGHTVCPDDVS